MDEVLKTHNSPLITLRNEADEEASPLVVATESNFTQKPSAAIRVSSGTNASRVNAVQIQMCGGSADNETFTWLLYGWRRDNGIATLMCNGTGTLGTMQVVTYPNKVGSGANQGRGDAATSKFWADTLTIASSFVKTWSVSGSGANGAAIISGDLAGFTDLYLEIQNADGTTGAEAGDISAFYAGW